MSDMSGSPIELFNGQPGTVLATIFTAGRAQRVKVTTIIVSNTTGVAATLTLEHVPSGAAAGVSHMIADALSVGANATVNVLSAFGEVDIAPGDTLQALQGTASSLNLFIEGEQFMYGATEF